MNWPRSTRRLMIGFRIFNFDAELLQLDCIMPMTSYSVRLAVQLSAPLLVVVVFASAYYLSFGYTRFAHAFVEWREGPAIVGRRFRCDSMHADRPSEAPDELPRLQRSPPRAGAVAPFPSLALESCVVAPASAAGDAADSEVVAFDSASGPPEDVAADANADSNAGDVSALEPLVLLGLRRGHVAKPWALDKTLNALGLAVEILYISMLKASMQLFQCFRQPNDTRTLVSDPSIECGGDVWRNTLPLSIAGFVVYSAGVLVVFGYALWRAPRYTPDSTFVQRIRFLLLRFRATKWYWGVFLLLRKFSLTLVLSLAADNALVQTGASIVLMLFFLGLQLINWPFYKTSINYLDGFLIANHISILVISYTFILNESVPEQVSDISYQFASVSLIVMVVVAIVISLGVTAFEFRGAYLLSQQARKASRKKSQRLETHQHVKAFEMAATAVVGTAALARWYEQASSYDQHHLQMLTDSLVIDVLQRSEKHQEDMDWYFKIQRRRIGNISGERKVTFHRRTSFGRIRPEMMELPSDNFVMGSDGLERVQERDTMIRGGVMEGGASESGSSSGGDGVKTIHIDGASEPVIDACERGNGETTLPRRSSSYAALSTDDGNTELPGEIALGAGIEGSNQPRQEE